VLDDTYRSITPRPPDGGILLISERIIRPAGYPVHPYSLIAPISVPVQVPQHIFTRSADTDRRIIFPISALFSLGEHSTSRLQYFISFIGKQIIIKSFSEAIEAVNISRICTANREEEVMNISVLLCLR
jgi:hypothetical protein